MMNGKMRNNVEIYKEENVSLHQLFFYFCFIFTIITDFLCFGTTNQILKIIFCHSLETYQVVQPIKRSQK